MSTNLPEAFEDIKTLMLQGKGTEAFEKYYAEDVVMQDNEHPPTTGKAANREREAKFYEKLIEFRDIEVKNVAYGEDLIISEWFLDFTHKELGKITHNQVSVQKWKDGKVIHERFYYAT